MKKFVLRSVLQSVLRIVCFVAVAAPVAQAGLVMQYTGSVFDIYDPIGAFSGVALGGTVSGEVGYSGSNPPNFSDSDFAQYQYTVGGDNHMTANVGAYHVEARQDLYLQLYSPTNFVTGVDFQFIDADTSLLSTAGLPSGFQLANLGAYVGLFTQSYRASSTFPTPPSSLLDLTQYDDPATGGFFFVDVLDANGAYVDSSFVSFSLTSIQAVPEPSSFIICLMGVGMLAVVRRSSIRRQC